MDFLRVVLTTNIDNLRDSLDNPPFFTWCRNDFDLKNYNLSSSLLLKKITFINGENTLISRISLYYRINKLVFFLYCIFTSYFTLFLNVMLLVYYANVTKQDSPGYLSNNPLLKKKMRSCTCLIYHRLSYNFFPTG